jgi:nicotinate phosphoribosyltransferase
MALLSALYPPGLSLLTDLYQLTMAEAAWKAGVDTRRTVFHLAFRKQPFGGGYAVTAGLEAAIELIENFRVEKSDLRFLASLPAPDGTPLFDAAFLERLAALRLEVDVDAIPEGSVVFTHEPLLRVTGPFVDCVILETPLLTFVNFGTLIATKAARISEVARGDPVLEFGLRRAQGPDGGVSAARAAFIGGCDATSNLLAGKLLGIPVRGTHAHSWVMLFDDERAAFLAYARAQPHNASFLVDTYDTLGGVRHAIEVGRELQAEGHALLGVRLDSGDLAYLSGQARRLLDEAGFPEAKVLATNDLDEATIESLKRQGARIDTWGVGTRLVTGHAEGALGGVYKLGAVWEEGAWRPRLKLSEQSAKISTPGVLQVRRFEGPEGFVADLLYDANLDDPGRTLVDPLDSTRQRTLDPALGFHELLIPVLRAGRRVAPAEPLLHLRDRARVQREKLHPTIRRLLNPHEYPVGLDAALHRRRTELILEARRRTRA